MNEIAILSNPRRRGKKRVHYRRNPSVGGMFGALKSVAVEGAVGAVGGIANDALFGLVKNLSFFPEVLKTGFGRTGAKLASALLVGTIAGKVGLKHGKAFAVGAATVTLHEALTSLANQYAPSLPLGAYEDNLLGWDSAQPVGAYMRTGAYIETPKQPAVGDLLTP